MAPRNHQRAPQTAVNWSCRLSQPLIPQADRDCLNAWADDVAEDFRGEDPPEQETQIELRAALQKVKTVLRGSALSEAELLSVQSAADERTGIETLVRDWAQGPQFERKLQGFLKVALQQQLQGFQGIQFDRLNVNRAMRERLIRVMEESFVRTAMDLIEREQPFNQVANTQTWMVTTANLILLKYADQSEQSRQQNAGYFRIPVMQPVPYEGKLTSGVGYCIEKRLVSAPFLNLKCLSSSLGSFVGVGVKTTVFPV